MGIMLLDELSQPPLRAAMTGLLASATHADFAAREIRLAGLDLDHSVLPRLQCCRILMGRLDSSFHQEAGDALREHAARLRRLLGFVRTGRFEVRSAGIDRWLPDFSLYGGLQSPLNGRHSALLFGAHYFERPYPVTGAALTALITHPQAIGLARVRFEQLWDRSYDVLPVITETLAQLIDEHDGGDTSPGRTGDSALLAG